MFSAWIQPHDIGEPPPGVPYGIWAATTVMAMVVGPVVMKLIDLIMKKKGEYKQADHDNKMELEKTANAEYRKILKKSEERMTKLEDEIDEMKVEMEGSRRRERRCLFENVQMRDRLDYYEQALAKVAGFEFRPFVPRKYEDPDDPKGDIKGDE